MSIERIDNWELVLQDSDLNANNRYTIEDSHIRCALIREIGTDSASMVDFGLRDHPFIDIDTFIAPYYKSSNNLNLMKLSGKKGLNWSFTGFELPLPLDAELEINGLTGDDRVYMKGSLYKGVLSTDAAINQYLMARLIEHSYKQLRPLYWRDVTVPVGLAAGKEYVLNGDAGTLVEWKPQDPRYTMAPAQNLTYVINNTIQVLWTDEDLLPKDVEFRMKHDRIDVGAMPRLDHMFLPPADGITRYVEETLAIGCLTDCDSVWAADGGSSAAGLEPTIKKEGDYSAKITWNDDFETGLVAHEELAAPINISAYSMVGFWIRSDKLTAPGDISILLCSDAAGAVPLEEFKLPGLAANVWTYIVGMLKRPEQDTAIASVSLYGTVDVPAGAGDVVIYLDDFRGLPLKVSHNPMESFVKETFTGGSAAEVSSVNYANGEISITYGTVPTSLLAGYYALREGGGRDIFSLRAIEQKYHRVVYPHKQSYTFTNKTVATTPSGTYTMDLYTLAQYFQEIPSGQGISPAVLAAARGLLV